MAAAGPRALWYLTRGTGVVSMLLLTLAVVLGIVTSVRWVSPRWPRFVTEQLHRNVSLLVLVFLAVHVATAVIDAFAPIRWLDAVVPFASAYRPVWVGLGALALDLLVAVAATSLMRVRLGYRAWRAVHWAAYACWPVALLHALGTGSDTRQGWMLLVDVAALAAVVVAACWRAAGGWPERRGGRVAALGASVLMPVAIAVWVVVGPLRAGWARTAGTPGRLLTPASAAPTEVASSPPATTAGVPAPPFSATFSGSVDQRSTGGGIETIELQGPLSGPAPMVLDVSLHGRALANGLALQDGRVRLGPPGDPGAYQGDVTGLRGGRIQAVVADARGARLALSLVVEVGNGSVHGVLRADGAGASGGVEGGDSGQ